ncbi:hypothetical protein MtrunA17_Chr8g0371271 [Medicago truncatula]|uniref:Uncharacterized protein n=1 Tax=Medicago truncatula TaxID=3880 RepID=A0A396GT26_MEDTR|nr:hypothetical protein MtrunA17_Chr8g0371271 [Medicago truncatula]
MCLRDDEGRFVLVRTLLVTTYLLHGNWWSLGIASCHQLSA